VERHKSSIVNFDNHQVEGIDFTETFAPVMKKVIVQVFLVVSNGNYIRWMFTMKNDLHDEVYIKMPPDFQVSSS